MCTRCKTTLNYVLPRAVGWGRHTTARRTAAHSWRRRSANSRLSSLGRRCRYFQRARGREPGHVRGRCRVRHCRGGSGSDSNCRMGRSVTSETRRRMRTIDKPAANEAANERRSVSKRRSLRCRSAGNRGRREDQDQDEEASGASWRERKRAQESEGTTAPQSAERQRQRQEPHPQPQPQPQLRCSELTVVMSSASELRPEGLTRETEIRAISSERERGAILLTELYIHCATHTHTHTHTHSGSARARSRRRRRDDTHSSHSTAALLNE
jgi:hypothetical protein